MTLNSPDTQPSKSAVTASERRRHGRYTVNVQIEVHQEGSDVPMRLVTTDLSRGGCYIQTMIPLSVGRRVRATLWLDGCAVVFGGLVVTRHPQFGNGIMFVEIEGEGEQLLARYLDGIVS
jgi:hypothetical protein